VDKGKELDTFAPMGPWLVTIDVPHHEIHEGEGLSYWFNASLGALPDIIVMISFAIGRHRLYSHFNINYITASTK
jgi:2-keto-4-pentenoate hydratase/2-oxohepta-3-ene-1,7-dioic acid hydratase in catechol pathway